MFNHRQRTSLAAAMLAAVLAGCDANPVAEVPRVGPEQARLLLDGHRTFLLDVRTEAEYQERHIPGTDALIPLQELEKRRKELDPVKGRPILVYCRSGNRSLKAAEILNKHGFLDVTDLRGGILDWSSKGFPTATGPFQPPANPPVTK